MTIPAVELEKIGTAVWLDDLSRDLINSGDLNSLIQSSGVIGVTTNPAIFASAMSSGHAYDTQISQLAAQGATATEAVFTMAVQDVQNACDAFAEVAARTHGVDGRVSLEVDPRYADDVEKTVAQAIELSKLVARNNLHIKIPATDAGLQAIPRVLEAGISVNVTLIFSLERYKQVAQAYIDGLKRAQALGRDLSTLHSVASFFISRVDSAIDGALNSIGTDRANSLKGKAGIANARIAYATFEEIFSDSNSNWIELKNAGALVQRPLWASTSTKDPSYLDTLYVTNLAGPHTVNTMPMNTLTATNDHAELQGDTLTDKGPESLALMKELSDIGVDLPATFIGLEVDGVQKFIESWQSLLDTMQERLDATR